MSVVSKQSDSRWKGNAMSDYRFVLDPHEDGQPVLIAVSEGPTWNGFRSPVATAGAVRSFIRRWQSVDPNGVWGSVVSEDKGAPVSLTVTRSDSDDPDEWDHFPVAGDVDGEPVYDLSGWAWVAEGDE